MQIVYRNPDSCYYISVFHFVQTSYTSWKLKKNMMCELILVYFVLFLVFVLKIDLNAFYVTDGRTKDKATEMKIHDEIRQKQNTTKYIHFSNYDNKVKQIALFLKQRRRVLSK